MFAGSNIANRDLVAARIHWVIRSGLRYWRGSWRYIENIPQPIIPTSLPTNPELAFIDLPAWAADIGVEGKLISFSTLITPAGELPDWQRCDWFATAFHLMAGTLERQHEAASGPILSYAFRLPPKFQVLFDHAWVNRIFLFLRRWAAHHVGKNEAELFGPLPAPEIILTHDVDALSITPEIRLKQSLFQALNAGKSMMRGKLRDAVHRFNRMAGYATARGSLNTLAEIRQLESDVGLRSILHIYAGQPGIKRGSLRKMLIDPAYDIGDETLRHELRQLVDGGWTIGLHQSFDAWDTSEPMILERKRLEEATRSKIETCRQHWLHFSWARTWQAQAASGFRRDSTLGFNDRPGFRASHALALSPWDETAASKEIQIEIRPMIFMDSHFYDYSETTGPERHEEIKKWISEVQVVHGVATVNWHTHTITDYYGWRDGYLALLKFLP